MKLTHEDLKNDSISLTESKTNKKRIIKLNDNIKQAFVILQEGNPNSKEFVFTYNQNTVLCTQYVNRMLKITYGAKNLDISSYSLRKTFGRQVWANNSESKKALL